MDEYTGGIFTTFLLILIIGFPFYMLGHSDGFNYAQTAAGQAEIEQAKAYSPEHKN